MTVAHWFWIIACRHVCERVVRELTLLEMKEGSLSVRTGLGHTSKARCIVNDSASWSSRRDLLECVM